jgi:Acetamidase/Formamidase family
VGTTVRFETNDCFSGQIRTEDDLVTEIDFERVNSATGPVAVTGAQPGDSLGGFGGCQGPQTRMERKASVWMEGNLGTSRY